MILEGRKPFVRDGVVTAGELLRRPVRLRGLRIGLPGDLVLEPERLRVVGLEVDCGDDERRFLPLAAARVREDEIEIGSALVLLGAGDLAFYRRRGRTLSAVRGRAVQKGRTEIGRLADLVLDPEGNVLELVLEGGERVAAAASLRLAGRPRASAA